MGRMSRRRTDNAGPEELWEARRRLHAGEIQFPSRPIVIVDIDGTLSNPAHRLHFIQGHGRRKDWDSFFGACGKDPPVEAVVRWTRALTASYTVVLVSGRPISKAGTKTLGWLAYYRVPHEYLFMRRGADRRPDTEVKQEILDDILRVVPKDRIAFAIDDRLSVIEQVWRRNKIRVFPVRANDEDTL
jgi:hypothetical protein